MFNELIGKRELVSSVKNSAGFNCDTCKELFKDSASYLSHLNSKGHLLLSGNNVSAEKATLQQVKDAFKKAKNQRMNDILGFTEFK